MDEWQRFCVVGLGRHAQTHLLPALKENKKKLVGVVSSHLSEADNSPARLFKSVGHAVNSVPENTCFLISSAPQQHYQAICQVVEAGFDVLVEKPAFVNHGEALNAIEKARKHEIIFCEAFMFKHTTLYDEALRYWCRKKAEVSEIRIKFLLPDLPRHTFRDDSSLENSILFDVGCYAITVMSDLSVPLEHIQLDEVLMSGDRLRYVRANSKINHKIVIEFGFGYHYINMLEFVLLDGSAIKFEPIFFGREGERTIQLRDALGEIKSTKIREKNAFANMFSTKLSYWRNSQEERLDKIEKCVICLETLRTEILSTAK